MRVTVLLPGVLHADADGRSRLDVEVAEGATLTAVLDTVAGLYPALDRRLRDEQRGLRRYVNFYVGGEECRRLDGAATRLADGAEVHVIPSVAGG
ncbi:MoaD/ThiS family protein [Sphaerisporangium sp. TRM90804]|uniref:MoaD/ThiS family protein n=1 Tax=Sphaerisporangium sp. TRM90804 TaxID=3031113 RepID=UPI002447B8DB|nr:MoaD/ThiS family protein [Sphaerisporangium sp. TRM90804]MDH2429637.1 MoaD/ThiS family protein [Sphaerisporangium sp. TRM90804]